jgi:beta-phosphoglucomutase-like phosphatase (HAD superfamily)
MSEKKPRRPLPARIQAVVFDMDGLLIDSEPVWNEAIDAFCRARGARYTREDVAACMGRGIPFVTEHLAARWGWPLEREAQVQAICEEFAGRVPSASACEGAEQLLRAFQGFCPLGLATSSPRWLAEAALKPRGWWDFFAQTVTGSDVVRHKPAPDIYLEAVQRLGAEATACLAFEDSPVGCEAAAAAGLFVVAVPGAHGGHPPAADLIAPSLTAAARTLGLPGGL